ncbi:hypothetical protein GOP47_0028880 [Adiantum capillus-veneris]|nr:hypothetical protein GOP47_0028880 [Adiantum capillus-veneris]
MANDNLLTYAEYSSSTMSRDNADTEGDFAFFHGGKASVIGGPASPKLNSRWWAPSSTSFSYETLNPYDKQSLTNRNPSSKSRKHFRSMSSSRKSSSPIFVPSEAAASPDFNDPTWRSSISADAAIIADHNDASAPTKDTTCRKLWTRSLPAHYINGFFRRSCSLSASKSRLHQIAVPANQDCKSSSIDAGGRSHSVNSSKSADCRRQYYEPQLLYYSGAAASPSNRSPLHKLVVSSPKSAASVLARHYRQQRVNSDELARKTFLPYRTTLLGC